MSSAQVASSAREQKLVICSSAPRLSQASARGGMTGSRFSSRASSSSSSTSGNWRANAWLAAAARLKTTRWSPRVMLEVMTVIDGPRVEAQVAGLAVDGMDRVAVRRVREDGVVRPAELLDRRRVARREHARRVLDTGEGEPAAEPLVRAVSAGALDREAEQALALLGQDVEREDHAGRAGVRLDRDAVGLGDRTHGREPNELRLERTSQEYFSADA